MESLVCKLDINAEARFYTLEEIRLREPDFDEWTLRNDMIKSVVVDGCELGFLSLGIDYESGRQGVGYGYRSEGNIGLMICALSNLLETRYVNGDALAKMAGKPIRVLFKSDIGGSVADCTYIGHFMKDRFVKMSELVRVGIVKEGGDE